MPQIVLCPAQRLTFVLTTPDYPPSRRMSLTINASRLTRLRVLEVSMPRKVFGDCGMDL